jgi:hypothetical protein
MEVPDASTNLNAFAYIGMKKSVLMGMHSHGFCCKKGGKGKYTCCLVFKQGLHKWKTCPLLMIQSIQTTLQKNNMQTYELSFWKKILLQC